MHIISVIEFLIFEMYYCCIHLALQYKKLKSIFVFIGALLLESKIQHDTVYQKQQVSLFYLLFKL